jgi:hypothetical protein
LQKIVDAEDKNPNEFWKYVDKLKVKVNNDPSSNISPNEWLTYFKHYNFPSIIPDRYLILKWY